MTAKLVCWSQSVLFVGLGFRGLFGKTVNSVLLISIAKRHFSLMK